MLRLEQPPVKRVELLGRDPGGEQVRSDVERGQEPVERGAGRCYRNLELRLRSRLLAVVDGAQVVVRLPHPGFVIVEDEFSVDADGFEQE